ncbi:hypothetical protein BDA99DRAFT_84347 [Phascolomyces articulosus]|uniref:F-box domain-containing protein n=1 Tax=Phascolomyces articulosus TaxID=60185 RepID=A0AAD5PD99_9FUNG|nr:hypothetical protein BDA99DRAFT_84347 [Phascolomyces articulosus]
MNFSHLAFFFTQSQLQCHSFEQYYENAQSAFTCGHLQEAEMNLTVAADTITHTLSMILLNRAVVRGIQGNIETGLTDAYKTINMNPTLPEAYLCAGALLKSDQKLTDALRLYKAGLNKMTIRTTDTTSSMNGHDNSDTHKKISQLCQVMNDLQLEINAINAGIFKKLPHEILSNIVTLLPYRDRLTCAATCHTWRSQLYDNLTGTMWHDLEFANSMDLNSLDLQLAHISHHTDHIREVYLSSRCDPQMSLRVLQFLTTCSRLEKLDIRVEINDSSNMDTISVFYQVLKCNQDSLRRITVRSNLPCVVVGIINCCPLLAELEFDATSFHSMVPQTQAQRQRIFWNTFSHLQQPQEEDGNADDLQQELTYNDKLEIIQPSPSPASSSHPGFNITRLELMNAYLDTLPDFFWQQLPSLRHFIARISFISNLPNIARAILRYCPDIKTFDLGPALNKERRSLDMEPTDFPPFPTISNYFYNNNYQQQPVSVLSKMDKTKIEKGLVKFNVLAQTMRSFGFDDELSNLVYNSRKTIESFHIRPRIIYGNDEVETERSDEDDSNDIPLVSPSTVTQHLYTLTHLRDLGFHGHLIEDLLRFGIDIGIIVRNCPMLESLSLDEISIRNSEMYQITLHANNLRRFRLVLASPHDHYTVDSMKHFLNHTQAKLEDVYLDGSSTLDNEALSILGTKHRSHLKSFALFNCRTVTIEGLNAFATAVATGGHRQQSNSNNNYGNSHHHCHRPKFNHLTLYHLLEDIGTEQCFDQVLKPLIVTNRAHDPNLDDNEGRLLSSSSLQSFNWITGLPPPENNETLINSLENFTSNAKGNCGTTTGTELKVRTLFGTKEYWEYTCKPGKNVISKYVETIPLSKLRHT